MRPRDLPRLASRTYDVLVVGGGIHGLTCAYEAASRGLSVALVEAVDFGSGISFNHQKTAHGGLRSLQSLSVRRARASIRERRALARIAPWLLRPLPFLAGTYRSLTRGRLALRAGFALDQRLGRHRNEGLEPELHLPRPRLLSRTATIKLFPGIREPGLTGGAQWYDYQMVENDRLTFAFAAAADRAGAELANYAVATSAIKAGSNVVGVRVSDSLTGAELEVTAQVIVNAAGAAAGHVLGMLGGSRRFPLVKAMNLVTSKRAAEMALAAPGPDGRMLTLVPWRGHAIVGTSQSAHATTAAVDERVAASEVADFVRQANHAFPALQLTPQDITLIHRGWVPAVTRGNDGAALLPESEIFDHASEGVDRVVTIVGAKYTTARGTAERAVNLIARKLGKRVARSRTATTILPGAGIADHEALAIEHARRLNLELPLPLIGHLITRYAETTPSVIDIISALPDSMAPLSPDTSTIGAEVIHVIRAESALRLSDIVLRRTTVGAAGHPGAATLQECAAIAARELDWPPERVGQEITDVERVYEL
jgi:glycerol-3-phosphate dehydrogenase